MLKVKFFLILVLMTYLVRNYSQNFQLINKNENIQITLLKDSIIVEIKNQSDKTIFLPIENSITQNCSQIGKTHYINLGLDLQVFVERGRFELEELKPKASKRIMTKLDECYNDSIIYFEFQFYMKKGIVKDNLKPIYNTDFLDDQNWLEKGEWEWGELIIDNRFNIK